MVRTFDVPVRLYIVFGTTAETRSTRVTFFTGFVRWSVYVFPDGYRAVSRWVESA